MTAGWTEQENKAKTMTVPELRFSIQGCYDAARACDDHDPERAGYYSDEASVYVTELNRR